MIEPQKLRKLQEFLGILEEQGQSAERDGRNEDAVKSYIKLVDVLLLLARESEDHTKWSEYTKQAEAYQNRVKSLIPPDQEFGARPIPRSPEQRPQVQKPIQQKQTIPSPAVDQAAKGGALRKILKPFQHIEDPIATAANSPALAPSALIPQSTTTSIQRQQQKPSEQEIMISSLERKLEAAIGEIKLLKEKLDAQASERENIVSYYESQVRELNEKLSVSIPKSEFDMLQSQFSEMITKQEYERLKAEISQRVPKEEYDELLGKLMSSVPRELYLTSELKVARLEENLKESLPKKVLDDLSAEVTLLAMLANIPMEQSENPQGASEKLNETQFP